MHVLITGGYGLLGRAVAAVLLAGGHRVHLTARTPHGEERRGVGVSVLDVTQPHTFAGLPSDVDTVVHAAAAVSTHRNSSADLGEFWRVNAVGTMNLLAWAEAAGVRTCVYCSTISVYAPGSGRPLTEESPTLPGGDDWAYALSKLAGEVLTLQSAISRVFVLRFSTLFGPGMLPGRVIPRFLDRVRRGEPVDVYSQNWVGDFLYVKDAAAAVGQSVTVDQPGGVFNIASGIASSLTDVADAVRKVAAPGARITITTAEKTAMMGSRVDVSKARTVLGFQPRFTLRAGLADWLAGGPA